MTNAERIAELEAQVRWLEEELGRRFDMARAISNGFALTRRQGELLCLLYHAKGRSLSHEFLNAQLPETKDQPRQSGRAISVHIYHIRRAIGRSSILTENSLGYRLSATGRQLLDGLAA